MNKTISGALGCPSPGGDRLRMFRTGSMRGKPSTHVVHMAYVPLCFLLLMPSLNAAYAAGFFVDQQSVRGLGRVNAGSTAASDDPSTIFFNPAGMARLWDQKKTWPSKEERGPSESHAWWMSVGTQVLVPRADLTDGGSTVASPGTGGFALPSGGGNIHDPADPTPIPNLFIARRIDESQRLFIGFGLNAPFGLSAEFRPDSFARYDALEASLRTINVSAVLALRLSRKLSIGGGVDAQYARSKLVQAIPDPLAIGGPSPATDGRIETRGNDWSFGYNVGLLYEPRGDTRIGAHFRSGMKHTISGTAVTSGLTGLLSAANGSVDASAALNLPAMVAIGIAHDVTDRLTVLANFEWYDWSTFDEIRVRFSDGRPEGVRETRFKNAWAAAVGADYDINDRLTLRGGLRVDRTPTVDGFRDATFPDADRFWVGIGATYRFNRQWTADFAAKHAFFEKGKIGVTRTFFDGTPLATTARVTGTADSSVTTVSANVSYAF
jgi:long-chain fatty acid transport protein